MNDPAIRQGGGPCSLPPQGRETRRMRLYLDDDSVEPGLIRLLPTGDIARAARNLEGAGVVIPDSHFELNLISRSPEAPDQPTARTKVVSARRLLLSSQRPPAIHVTSAPLVPTGRPTWFPRRLKPPGEKA